MVTDDDAKAGGGRLSGSMPAVVLAALRIGCTSRRQYRADEDPGHSKSPWARGWRRPCRRRRRRLLHDRPARRSHPRRLASTFWWPGSAIFGYEQLRDGDRPLATPGPTARHLAGRRLRGGRLRREHRPRAPLSSRRRHPGRLPASESVHRVLRRGLSGREPVERRPLQGAFMRATGVARRVLSRRRWPSDPPV